MDIFLLELSNVGNSFFMILPFLAPLNARRGRSIFPEAVTVVADVAYFVSFVDLCTWTVLALTTSNVVLELNVNGIGVWSIFSIRPLL